MQCQDISRSSQGVVMTHGSNVYKPCPCGSGHASWWENDARGIPLCRVCEICQDEKLAAYRPDVLTNANYDHDEPIEDE